MSDIKESKPLTALGEDIENDIENDIWDYILLYMKQAEYYIKTGGKDKKTYVIKKIKELIGNESYERYEPFIIVSIDFIITLSRNKEILKTLNNKCFIGLTKCLNSCLRKK